MRVLMTGGGTAGHVNPAIAIANTIKNNQPDAEIKFVSSKLARDKANDLVPRAGYELLKVDICGSYPIWNPKNIKTAYSMIKSAKQAKEIIEDFKPDVIIGTGGFACYPVLNAGTKMGIPTLVHESNAIPGKAVKKLSGKVDCVMTNFESSKEMLVNAKRVVRVGNPIIESNNESSKGDLKGQYNRYILSFGGSQGAEHLTEAVCRMMKELCPKYPDIKFYHATGKNKYKEGKEYFDSLGLSEVPNAIIVDYIYDMNEQMKNADIIISRAGAMTLSELALSRRAAILVPSPYVAADHQRKNALAVLEKGGCIVVEESELTSNKLIIETEALINDEKKREELGEAFSSFAMPDANNTIYREIMKILKK